MAKRAKAAPYLAGSHLESMRQKMDNYLGKMSEFKKPYLWSYPEEDDGFIKMERFGDIHPVNPWTTPKPFGMTPIPNLPPGEGGKDCQPKIIDYSGSYFDCTCETDCCINVVISCSPNVKSVDIGGTKQTFKEGRRNASGESYWSDGVNLYVTVCGLPVDSKIPYTIETLTAGGGLGNQYLFPKSTGPQTAAPAASGTATYSNGLITGLFENNCCKNCENVLTIGYTSQQMSCGGSQTLTATNGGVPPTGKVRYTWTHTGGGSIDTTTGATVIYTAPTVGEGNAGCTNNATITVKDCCGVVATFHIAINCAAVTLGAYYLTHGHQYYGGGLYCFKLQYTVAHIMGYHCDGSVHFDAGDFPCRLCNDCLGPPFDYLTGCYMYIDDSSDCLVGNEGNPCTDANLWEAAHDLGCTALNFAGWNVPLDTRTDAQKAAGCCPVALL